MEKGNYPTGPGSEFSKLVEEEIEYVKDCLRERIREKQ